MFLFSIPDSGAVRTTNISLFSAISEHKQWFYDDFKIDIAYGCPPSCIWNGIRAEFGNRYKNDWVDAIAGFYRNNGVTYRLNFTNFLLRAEHLNDEYGNEIAKALNEFGGKVTVSIKLMHDYIKENYSNLGISWSTTTDYGSDFDEKIKKVNLLSKDEIVVLPYELNDVNLDVFSSPENLEILICDMCRVNCSYRKAHNTLHNKVILGELPTSMLVSCMWNENNGGVSDSVSCSVIGRKRLIEYARKKINRFKISGRVIAEQALAAYAYYFVVEKFRNDFFSYILQNNHQILVSAGILNPNAFNLPVLSYEKYANYLNILYEYGGE